MRKTVALFMLMALCMTSFARSRTSSDVGKQKEPRIQFSRTDSLPEIIQYYLRETSSKHFEDPKIPRFLLKDRTDSFVFGVGGSVDARLFYDHQGSTGNGFSISDEQSNGNDVIDLNMRYTNLSFKVLGKTRKGVVDAFVSVDFRNKGGGMRLTQAYIDIFGLRIGLANTSFRDDESLNLVDVFGNLSGTARKVPQVSYSYRFRNGMRIQAGAEFPQSTSVWVRASKDSCCIATYKTLIPDMTANFYYTRERIHLYGGINCRFIDYYNDYDKFDGVFGYAFQVGGNWSFVKRHNQTHKLYLQGVWAHGMADCVGSMRNQGLCAVSDLSTDTFVVPTVFGCSAGYQVKFGDNTFDLNMSYNGAYGHEHTGIGSMYDYAYAGSINYFRKFLKYATAGIEGIIGSRHDVDGRSYMNSRVYVYLRYDF